MIKKLLIANRGEIACRIARSARKLGIETVAIYSDIDKKSKHVEVCDSAFHVGASPSCKPSLTPNSLAQSYLNVNKILDIAAKSGADAIHPGFGFLSENADFADTVAKNGKVFIGPPASAIKSMGSKAESKKIMTAANVPVVGGYFGENQDPKFLLEEAKKIGFPVLIKAVSGGGGKGMKIVNSEGEFQAALESAKRESLKSFKDDRVLVEKYITKPRHIEIQIFGDKLGNYVHLFERDCSVQRRHQKVIEEAPSAIGAELRNSIGQTAVNAAKAVGYYNAGTVEFIFDTETNKYYFMEMNTRLQVEHPITEMITGQDLVQWQLEVASGRPLPKKQNELSINGHSIEVRIYSEDPYNGFLPGNGKIQYLRTPVESKEVRLESGVRQGDEISIFYDPMIAKLITWGADREHAINKMQQALTDFKIGGLPNNVRFLNKCFNEPEFRSSKYDTRFIELHKDKLLAREKDISHDTFTSMVIYHAFKGGLPLPAQLKNFRVNQPWTREFYFTAKLTQNQDKPVTYTANITGMQEDFTIAVTGPEGKFEINGVTLDAIKESFVTVGVHHNQHVREIFAQGSKYLIFEESGEIVEFQFQENKIGGAKAAGADDKNSVKAPMPGTLVKLYAKEGDHVKEGAPLLVMEAMKMEHTIKAPKDLVVKKINYKEGGFVDQGEIIVAFD